MVYGMMGKLTLRLRGIMAYLRGGHVLSDTLDLV